MSMDDFLRNICDGAGGEAEGESVPPAPPPLPRGVGNRTVEEVRRESSGGRNLDVVDESSYGDVTLGDFLAMAVREEGVSVSSGACGLDQAVPQPVMPLENPILGFGNGVEGGGRGRGEGGRGRKRPVLDTVERAALQRQKRMIKNRESAARSRERKQAYTVELESLVTQLEEENARLLRERDIWGVAFVHKMRYQHY